MWSPVPSPPDALVPSSRSKHAATLHGQYLYVLGGRNGNVPLKDFWRYHIANNEWEQIRATGDLPSCLQEHTIVAYRDTLYVFGGEVGFSNGVETPLWMFDTQTSKWRKFCAPKGVVTPKGRRSHTATVFQDSMYIYGGYQDLKGSSSELWAFHFASETWHLVSQGGGLDTPPPRHRHSAVLHDTAMWIFGGMTDLEERSDFWRFDFVSRRWRPVKSKPGPGCLHSHCAVKFLSVMIIFGGEREGQVLNEMWRFHFATEFWERLSFASAKPMPRAQTVGFVFSQFSMRGKVHYMGLPEHDYFAGRSEHEEEASGEPSESGPEKKYSFAPAENCLDECEQISKEFFRDLRRPSHFQRFDNGRNSTILKDIAKISHVNLSRLSHYCSYTMFNNESTESINSASCSASPCSVKLARSQSSFQFPKDGDETLNLEEQKASEPVISPLARDPVSVPNFRTLQKANSLEDDQPDNAKTLSKATHKLGELTDPKSEALKPDLEVTKADIEPPKRSDSSFTFQSYDCSSRSSTLSSNPPPTAVSYLPKSNSIRFAAMANGEVRLIDLEEDTSEDYSSLSGYESIEAVNRSCDSRMSFANPHYLGPDIQTILQNRGVSTSDSHQSFAQALNSPNDSIFSDYQDFYNQMNNLEFFEMPALASPPPCAPHAPKERPLKERPKSIATTELADEIKVLSDDVPVRGQVARTNRPMSLDGAKVGVDGATSESRVNQVAPSAGVRNPQTGNQLYLYMYLLGGREIGQVTVFKRPISMWRLDLTKTF